MDDLTELMQSALASYEAVGVSGSEGARAMRGALARIAELEALTRTQGAMLDEVVPALQARADRLSDRIAELEAERDRHIGRANDQEDRADRLSAMLKEAVEALRRWLNSGCPDCGGDCASANPPVALCIMQDTSALLARLEAREEVSP
jgi:predicted S18 family serine protease